MRAVPEAGAIAARVNGAEPLFLVVTALKTGGHWIFPKGHIKRGERPEDAALRELEEEAGVRGSAAGYVGVSRYCSGKEDVEVSYFLVLADGEGSSREGRQLRWRPYAEARAALTFDDAKTLLDRAVAMLESR
ncbi:MAG TPA: NUDIX domain-containing protein [Patescibacteria group bacterium]|nr:NUDIX domain-containing protein [Patescibacteria group bacterium]